MGSIIGEIIIFEKKYSEKNLQLITGKKDISSHYQDIPEEMLLLSEVIEDPLKLPYLLEAFYTAPIKNEKAFHFALVRVQVDSDLRMHGNGLSEMGILQQKRLLCTHSTNQDFIL